MTVSLLESAHTSCPGSCSMIPLHSPGHSAARNTSHDFWSEWSCFSISLSWVQLCMRCLYEVWGKSCIIMLLNLGFCSMHELITMEEFIAHLVILESSTIFVLSGSELQSCPQVWFNLQFFEVTRKKEAFCQELWGNLIYLASVHSDMCSFSMICSTCSLYEQQYGINFTRSGDILWNFSVSYNDLTIFPLWHALFCLASGSSAFVSHLNLPEPQISATTFFIIPSLALL